MKESPGLCGACVISADLDINETVILLFSVRREYSI